MELERIKFKDLLKMQVLGEDISEYEFAIKWTEEFRKEDDMLGVGDVYELPYGLIKDFQHDLENESFDLNLQIEYLQKANPNLVINDSYLDEVTCTCSYMLSSITQLLENESRLLASEPTVEQFAAGLDKFNGLGIYLQIRQLTNNDVTKIDDVKKLPYTTCFIELYTRKQENDYSKELQEIHNKKTTN